MPEVLPPPRSLLYVRPVPAEQGGGLEIACDCGTVTQLIIEIADALAETREGAFTCDGCYSVRWFTVGPLGEAADGG
jgi:hypothetical protein